MKNIRSSSEAEVIAEFLKNEFYQEEFHSDRESFERLVLEAHLDSKDENDLRRALLFRRRGHMWREVPTDTQWWEVELEPSDLSFIRVFPRAQWRQIAQDSFLLRDIANRIRSGRFAGSKREFIARVQALSYRLRTVHDSSAVLLIGIDEQHPLTILEGNHRLTAALLAGPSMFGQQFRIFCGLSPHMSRSCWYETNVPNLWRYAQNRLRNLFYDRDADVSRVLRRITPPAKASALDSAMNPAGAGKIISGSK
jgi:hypothetical protein